MLSESITIEKFLLPWEERVWMWWHACMRAQANEWKFAPCFVLLPTYGAQAFSEDETWGQYHNIVFLKLYYKKSHPKRIKNSLLVALSLTTIKVFDRHCNSYDLPYSCWRPSKQINTWLQRQLVINEVITLHTHIVWAQLS